MSEQITDLGEWVKQLIYDVVFQPEDGLASTVADKMDPALELKINGQSRQVADWGRAILARRLKNELIEHSCRELLTALSADGRGGSVAHLFTFKAKNRETGDKNEGFITSIATVSEKGGERLLVQLTEVIN